MDLSLPAALRDRLRDVRSVGVVTGAGVSSECGIRTYRGKGGLYDDPEEGDRVVEALTGSTLARDPDRTWTVVAGLARQAGGARPGPAHEALVRIESKVDRFALLTQNVDGLHRLAGSRNLIEIHGNLSRTRCLSCGALGELDRSELVELVRAPRCGRCSGLLRPDVVLFEEIIPPDRYRRIVDEFHSRPPDLVIVAGTTALFPYVSEPVLLARRAGSLTVEINPEPTGLSDVVDFVLRGPAGRYLPLIDECL